MCPFKLCLQNQRKGRNQKKEKKGYSLFLQVCRDEKRQLVQNIPTEQCELEPREDCKMETVLVPR